MKTTRHKRIFAILLSAMLLTAFSAGCNKDNDSADKNPFHKENSDASEESSENSISETNGVINHLDALESTGKVYSQTILVYMVGSDLESEYGNASLDLEEMQAGLADTENINILVYTGGASEWQTPGISADENTILQVTADGFEVISADDAQNMGEAETLCKFIQYGLENSDSDQYSLILWNHGAGPVFGFGLDENYGDLLSLEEMQQALEDSVGASGKKLEMIGFDACLMSSLEVADAFSDYANYLVSSQETEPGWGWNYAFLSNLAEPDMNGARMGKAIIDSYMEYGEAVFAEYPKYYSDLTLSCVDLNQYAAVEDTLDDFFSSLSIKLDSTTFPEAVRRRGNTKDFGTYSSDFDYGMVDVVDLLEQLAGLADTSADEAANALEQMVVYMRTNVADAGGISICYPYGTDQNYTDYCMEMQKDMGFVSGYTDYLQKCSDIENGAPISSNLWSIDGAIADVKPMESTENKQQGGSDISLALTEEQQQNFGTATYYILAKADACGYVDASEDPRADEMYFFIHGGKNVRMDENGVIHAYYSDNVVYMKDLETGERSSTPMVLIDNDSSLAEKRYLTSVVLTKLDNFDVNSANLQIVVNDEYPNGIIRSAVPISSDEDEIKSASKQLLDLEDYDLMSVVGRCSYVTRDENGSLLPFFEWENSGILMGFEQNLKDGYALDVCPIENPQNYVCLFVVTDVQGNTTVSELIPLG